MKKGILFTLVILSDICFGDQIEAAKYACLPSLNLFEVTNFSLHDFYYGKIETTEMEKLGIFTTKSSSSIDCQIGGVLYSLRPIGRSKHNYAYSLFSNNKPLIRNLNFFYPSGEKKVASLRVTGASEYSQYIELAHSENTLSFNESLIREYLWSLSTIKKEGPFDFSE